MTDIPEPVVTATEYRVSCLPLDSGNAFNFTIKVEWRSGDEWVLRHNGAYLDADGNRSWGADWRGGEPRTEAEIDAYNQAQVDWLARIRFDRDTALALARRLAPLLRVGPADKEWTVADALAVEAADT